LLESILEYSNNPLVLAGAIIIIAWIWEDAALVSGALLAAEAKLNVPSAVMAVFVGICSGDLALYYLGRMGHRWRPLRAWMLTNPKSRGLRRRFRQRTMSNIMIIRFIPGLRTIGFTLCGLWRIALPRFVFAMAFAGVIWIALIFTLVYFLGKSPWMESGLWKWSLMGVAILLLAMNNIIGRRMARRPKAQ